MLCYMYSVQDLSINIFLAYFHFHIQQYFDNYAENNCDYLHEIKVIRRTDKGIYFSYRNSLLPQRIYRESESLN